MKIVHIMDWFIPNMGYQENFLPLKQEKLGNEVEIICSDKLPNFEGFDNHLGKYYQDRIMGSGLCIEEGIKVHRLSSSEIGNWVILDGLKYKLKELNPDIVQTHGTLNLSTFQSVFWSKELNYKVFVDDHSHENNFYSEILKKYPFSKIGYKSLNLMPSILLGKIFYKIYGRRVSKFMPVTYSAKKNLREIWNIPENKLSLIHLGVETEIFKKSEELREMGRKELNLNEEDILIVSSGKLTRDKDIDILLEALAKALEYNSKLKLLLIGKGTNDYMGTIHNLIKSLNLEKNVFFKDFVPNKELPIYYNAADIGLWPGDHSITVIEASATGLPLIIPENILAYQILTENNSAISFKRRNITSLSNQIIKLAENIKLRNLIGDNELELVENILSWDKVAEKTLSIYLNEG